MGEVYSEICAGADALRQQRVHNFAVFVEFLQKVILKPLLPILKTNFGRARSLARSDVANRESFC